jgi:hypothetical protein
MFGHLPLDVPPRFTRHRLTALSLYFEKFIGYMSAINSKNRPESLAVVPDGFLYDNT